MAIWDESKPAGSRLPSLGDDDIREFKTAIRERLAVDHEFAANESPAFGETGSVIGLHKRMLMTEQAAAPTVAVNQIALFGKEVGSKCELYLKDEDGHVIQLTKGGRLFLQDLDGEALVLDADGDSSITADTDDQIDIAVAGADQVRVIDGAVIPAVTNDLDLGSDTVRFKDGHLNGNLNVEGQINANGAVDLDGALDVAGAAVFGDTISMGTAALNRNSIPQGMDVTVAVHCKVISIGAWNMDEDGQVGVAHGLTASKIRMVGVVIRNDAGDAFYQYPYVSQVGSNAAVVDLYFSWGASAITIVRKAASFGGNFDSTDFDGTGFARGYITIWYVD